MLYKVKGAINVVLLILLVPIGIAIILGSWLIGSPIMALCNLMEGKFIKAGIWLCAGLFALNAINHLFLDQPWADFMPIYYLIGFVVIVAEALKLYRRFRRESGPELPELVIQAESREEHATPTLTLVRNKNGVYVPNGR